MKPFVLSVLVILACLSLFAGDPAPVVPENGTVVTSITSTAVNRCGGCKHAEAATTEALKENFRRGDGKGDREVRLGRRGRQG